MNEGEFRKKAEKLVREKLPNKRKVGSCVELLWRLYRYTQADPDEGVLMSRFTQGIKGAGKHLRDMEQVGLVDVTQGDLVHFIIDLTGSTTVWARGRDEISALIDRYISELIREIEDNPDTRRCAYASVGVNTKDDFIAEVSNNDKSLDKAVKAVEAKGLHNKSSYAYSMLNWRTVGNRWSLGNAILRLL
jgi:hypothetical protein